MTSKHYSIAVEDGMSRAGSNSLLQNCLKQLFPEKPTKDPPSIIYSSVVDVIRVGRLRGAARLFTTYSI